MPIKARWEQHGAYFTVSGIVPIGEVLGARKFMLDPPEGVLPKYQIIDALRVERYDFDQMDQFNVAVADLSVGERYPSLKFALITDNPEIHRELTDHFKTSWSMGSKLKFGLFSTVAEAREWIGLPYPKEKDDNGAQDNNSSSSLWLPGDN